MGIAHEIERTTTPTYTGRTVHQRHYRVTPPLEGHEFLIVSAVDSSDHGPETYIFGADKFGSIVNYLELKGSFIGGKDHRKALENAGYTLVAK